MTSTIRCEGFPARPPRDVPAVPCLVCGTPAADFLKLCDTHWSGWCQSKELRIAKETEEHLMDAWAAAQRETNSREAIEP